MLPIAFAQGAEQLSCVAIRVRAVQLPLVEVGRIHTAGGPNCVACIANAQHYFQIRYVTSRTCILSVDGGSLNIEADCSTVPNSASISWTEKSIAPADLYILYTCDNNTTSVANVS